jgi:hypothetical protein
MRPIVGLLVLSLMTLFCGCGSGANSTLSQTQPSAPAPPPPPPTPTVNGNWAVHTTSEGDSVNDGGGYFTTTGTAVTGTINLVSSSQCYSNVVNGSADLDSISLTGTISSSGALMLTSSPIQGQGAEVLTITGTVSGNNLNDGAYSVSGGCADGDIGTVSGWAASPLNGTYTGNFLSKSGLIIGASVAITQASQPATDGIYSASGTVTFANSPCFSSGTFSPTDQGDPSQLIFGDFVQVEIETNGAASVVFQGTVDSTGKTITGTYSVLGGICSEDSGTGIVTER